MAMPASDSSYEPIPPREVATGTSGVRLSGQETAARIALARPDLTSDSPWWQGAVLLLHASSFGLNVDRVVRRTGYSRDFVARCFRRLVDNACWIDGELRANWSVDFLGSEAFWHDVNVALGNSLRRINDQGEPEWAPVGGWVKEFNYRGAARPEEPIHNEYHRIEPYNPDPDGASELPAVVAELAPTSILPFPSPTRHLDAEPVVLTATRPAAVNRVALSRPALSSGWEHAKWIG